VRSLQLEGNDSPLPAHDHTENEQQQKGPGHDDGTPETGRLLKRRSSSMNVTPSAGTPGTVQPGSMSAGECDTSEVMMVAEGGVASEERSVRPRHCTREAGACTSPGLAGTSEGGLKDSKSMACA
jgi:hypothetical protein